MEGCRVKVGSNSLIIENIVKYCQLETKLNCCLVNSIWRDATQKRLRLNNRSRIKKLESDPDFQALLDTSLNTFANIGIHFTIPPQLLDYFRSSLISLELNEVSFSDVTELSTVLFYTFPNMKQLILDDIGVPAHEKHVSSCTSDEIIPVSRNLESLTIKIPEFIKYYKEGEVSGVPALGLNSLFQNFNKIKTLKLDIGPYEYPLDIFGAILQANVIPPFLEFLSYNYEFDFADEYLTTYGGQLLHVYGNNVPVRGKFQNISVAGWLSVRMDGVNWSTFGHGNFESLLRLELVQKYVECFDFLHRMPVVKEIKFVESELSYVDEGVPPVIAIDRNPPCPTVTSITFAYCRPDSRQELYFYVFPNVTKVYLSCDRNFLSKLVNRWEKLTKLQLENVCDADAAFITEIVTCLYDLDNFEYSSGEVTFGDAEGQGFLFHAKLKYLRLAKVSMNPILIRRLKRKLIVFEFAA